MRLLVAVGLWLLFLLGRFGVVYGLSKGRLSAEPVFGLVGVAGTLISLAIFVGIIFTIIRVAERDWGLKWWYVFTLLLPFYNVYVIGRVFWYWAGRITGARPIQPEVGAVSNRP